VRNANVGRIIYASSVAAYGSSDKDATEATPLAPTTPYAEAKRDAENWLRMHGKGITCITRSASVCGYSGRMRFDTTVNKMTHDAIRYGSIKVNGGSQKRSHIHIQDLAQAYRILVTAPADVVAGQVFNLVGENQTVLETAQTVANETARRSKSAPRPMIAPTA
jgi:nucleoside-diphosphate-sugar epimerase